MPARGYPSGSFESYPSRPKGVTADPGGNAGKSEWAFDGAIWSADRPNAFGSVDENARFISHRRLRIEGLCFDLIRKQNKNRKSLFVYNVFT